jgi:hypothetical protein
MKFRRIERDMKRPQCAHCHRTITPGQVGAYQELGPQHPITHRTLWFHGKCLVEQAELCPSDHDRQAFNDLRDQIAAAGVAFP